MGKKQKNMDAKTNAVLKSAFCNCMIHPFQNDPGTSQLQRIMDELLSGAVKIDARTTADLLDFFVKMSSHIQYYDDQLRVTDWQLFFKKSIPFTLSSIIKYNRQEFTSRLKIYDSLFLKKETKTGLQLELFYIYYHVIQKINRWYNVVKGSGLPIEPVLEGLIKEKLKTPVKKFILYANIAVKRFKIQRIDFSELIENEIWEISTTDLSAYNNSLFISKKPEVSAIAFLYVKIGDLTPLFSDVLAVLSGEAERNLEKSFLAVKEEFQKKNQPHLAVLFAFLNMFKHLQGNLNEYSKKHLDYFYRNILQLKAHDAKPDKIHVLFSIQKELKKYLLKKGLLVKDGKDKNKQDILFGLEDELVVNKTQITEKRTLFVNNKKYKGQTYVEGVYMAPDATKADGIKIDFADNVPANFPTVGAHLSKYITPQTKLNKPFPNARIGFILASPVLFLQGGTRKITIDLPCTIESDLCGNAALSLKPANNDCCNPPSECEESHFENTNEELPELFDANSFIAEINSALNKYYYYINEDLLESAVKKGMSTDWIEKLRQQYLIVKKTNNCQCPDEQFLFEKLIEHQTGYNMIQDPELSDYFKPFRIFNILFSGEKDWVTPTNDPTDADAIQISLTPVGSTYQLQIIAVVKSDKPAITFFDKEKLNEDYKTTLPLVKILLDDRIKLLNVSLEAKLKLKTENTEGCSESPNCCLLSNPGSEIHNVSLYHFFRNLKLSKTNKEIISVNVCGLKNFIVQNDEGIQDVNNEIYPFGNRPKLDANFYIGSKEVFYKDWQNCFVNINWKNRPDNFENYYQGYQNDLPPKIRISDFKNLNFKVQKLILNNGAWLSDGISRIFPDPGSNSVGNNILCNASNAAYETKINVSRLAFPVLSTVDRSEWEKTIKDFNVNSRNGFLKFELKNTSGNTPVDFQHDNYPFILSRQMMAFGKLPENIVDGAVYYDSTSPGSAPIVISASAIVDLIKTSGWIARNVKSDVTAINGWAGGPLHNISLFQSNKIREKLRTPLIPIPPANPADPGQINNGNISLNAGSDHLDYLFNDNTHGIIKKLSDLAKYAAIIPKEPYTPIISSISIDYFAFAKGNDIDFIHLHPFDGTYKYENLNQTPALFPTFCDEGTLFLGLKDLVPGNNLNILFQLAEATADSEAGRPEVNWFYLDNNSWKQLRKGFEVIDDATLNLTASGIIKLALPVNMTSDNTVMPKDVFWIKAAVAQKSKSIAETTGIHPQAMLATFELSDEHELERLSTPLPQESVSKLWIADASVKEVLQPYESFGGQVPEIGEHFYVRVSEMLHHKNRAIQKFDYERIVLEAFPQIYKVKCINHSFALNAAEYHNDFPYAPGFVVLAAIPDLFKLKAGNSYEPKVPLSLLEKIETEVRKQISPFVRFKAVNPRYEKINFCIKVQLLKGKDEGFYKEQLRLDIRKFLAPWAVGEFSKLSFGQYVYRSDIIKFIETLDYIDFIDDMSMSSEFVPAINNASKISPHTPRSILIAGDVDVCIKNSVCEDWKYKWERDENKNCVKEYIDACENKAEYFDERCKPKTELNIK